MPLSIVGPSGPGFETWLAALVIDAAVKGTIILLIAWVVTAALRRTSATVRHFVWCLAFVGLAGLPMLSITLPAWHVPLLSEALTGFAVDLGSNPGTSATTDGTSAPRTQSAGPSKGAPGTSTFRALGLARSGGAPTGSLAQPQVTVSDAASSADAASYISWQERLSRVWVLGALAALVPLMAGFVGQRWLTRRVRRLGDRAWLDPLEELRRHYRIWRSIRLCVSSRSVGPLTLGVFQPVVLIPAEARDWHPERRNQHAEHGSLRPAHDDAWAVRYEDRQLGAGRYDLPSGPGRVAFRAYADSATDLAVAAGLDLFSDSPGHAGRGMAPARVRR